MIGLSIDNPEALRIGKNRALNSVAGPAGQLFPALCVQLVDILFQ